MSKSSIRAQLKAETKTITQQINALVKEKEAELLKTASLSDKVIYFLEDTDRSTLNEGLFKGYAQNSAAMQKFNERLKEHNIGYEFTERIGGDEEETGNTYFAIWSFGDLKTKEEVFVKFDGYFSSYDGADMNSFYLVKPVEKTIIEYQKVR